MNLFYTAPENISGKRLVLTGQEALHAGKVLRHRTGDRITVTDGNGGFYTGEITSMERERIVVNIVEKESVKRPFPRIVVAFGLLRKRDRLEFAVEKSVELGACSITVFTGDHSEKSKVNLSRLQATALSAMKQSLRCRLPQINHVHSLGELLKAQKNSGRETQEFGTDDDRNLGISFGEKSSKMGSRPQLIVADETVTGDATDLKEISRSKDILAIVGPEGGFSAREREQLTAAGSRFISLGSHRLRTETAVVNFLSRLIG